MSIILSSVVYATSQAHGYDLVNSDSQTQKLGAIIIANDTYTLTSVTKHASSDAVTAYLLNHADQSEVEHANFVGNVATFNSQIIAGQKYIVHAWSGGASYTRRYYWSVGAFPVSNSLINWSGGWSSLGGDTLDNVFVILSINLEVPAAGGTLNFTNQLPVNGTSYFVNENLKFNVSVNSSSDFNCSLYLNDTVNETVTGITLGNNIQVNFTTTIPDGHYNHKIGCTNDNHTKNTTNLLLYVDTNSPFITWVMPSALNDSIVTGVLETNITIEDNNLYSYSYNITYPNGTVLFNYYNESLTGNITFDIPDKPNMTNYAGVFITELNVCDGHTKKEIKDMKIIKDDYSITFDRLKIKSKDKTQDITYIKKKDRYSFKFKYDNPKTKIELEIPEDCKYIEGSQYKGHFVCRNSYWLDFEGDYKIIVKNKKVEVQSLTPLTEWQFNSIGRLNCVEEHTQFFSTGITAGYNARVLSGDTTTYFLNISYDPVYITYVDVDLWLNGTEYGMSGNLIGDTYVFSASVSMPTFSDDINWSFFYEITHDSTYLNTSDYIQFVFAPKIDNCSTYAIKFINFTLKDELNDTLLEGDYSYLFQVNNGGYTFNYNGSMIDRNKISFCIYPNWSSVNTDITLQYSSTGYDNRDYVVDDFNVDNVTDFIDLYILESGVATQVTIHTVDNADTDLTNVFIEAYRWDIPTDTDKLVETEYTDNDGNAILNLKTGSEFYSFKFYMFGNLVLSTTRYKIFSTSLEYIISDTEMSIIEEYLQIKNIVGDVSFDNTTKLIRYTWDDPKGVGDKYCLNVTDYNKTYSSECSTSATGTMTYTILNLNNSYVAQGLAKYVNTTHFYLIDEENINPVLGMDTLGKADSLIIVLIIFIFFATMGVASKNLVLVFGGVGLFGIYFFGFTPLGFGTLIGVTSIVVLLLIVINKRGE